MKRAFLIGLLGLALAACVSAAPASQRLSGTWDWQFETSAFTTDAGEGPFWLHAEGQAWEDLNAPFREAGLGPWGQLRVVVEGELSEAGQYGHLGAYSRQLIVTRVVRAELLASSPRR